MKVTGKMKYFKFLKTGNFKLFLFFLIAAFIFLMLTKFAQSFTQELDLEITIDNLEDEIVIVNDSIKPASIVVEAKGFNLLKYLFTTTEKITIDSKTETSKKGNRLYWDLKSNKYKLKNILGNSVDILSVTPDTIFFDFDVLAKKTVPVDLISDIGFAEGYNVVGKLKMSQDSVKVIGSKKVIDTISSISLSTITLKDVNSDISETVNFKKTASNIKIVPNQLIVSGMVKQFTEGKFSIPIQLTNFNSEKSVNFFPKQAELIFYVDIDNYKNISPSDFKVVADFSNVDATNQKSVNLEIVDFPEKVKNVRLLQNRIEYIISN